MAFDKIHMRLFLHTVLLKTLETQIRMDVINLGIPLYSKPLEAVSGFSVGFVLSRKRHQDEDIHIGFLLLHFGFWR